ncbi:MAG TPA: metallophosphoesterase family protein [Xanthobacteraceae bacterium]|nr:metallophosphoesterase family protein [Xanthobacteraceae bacterium]
MPLTYAVGDIHGSQDKLKSLIAGCEEHAAGRPMTFVFLGDYIDRGPESAGVIRLMMSLQLELQERVVALKGNHEAWALSLLDGTMPVSGWLRNGGAATLASYGVKAIGDLPRAHLDWMRSLRLSYDDGRRFFVHAGVDPEKPLDAQDEQDLLWIRLPFLTDERDYGRLIVHGHTPLEDGAPELRGNRLNLDTAAAFGGPLTAAIFDDAQTQPLGFVQAR